MRLGIDRDYAIKEIDTGQAKAIESAIGVLRDLGARIVEIRMPDVVPRGRSERGSRPSNSRLRAGHVKRSRSN